MEYLDLNCATRGADDAGRFRDLGGDSHRTVRYNSNPRWVPHFSTTICATWARFSEAGRSTAKTGLPASPSWSPTDPSDRLAELIWLFARTERRREYLHTPMMIAQDSGDFELLAPGKVAR